jgi:hypothetical protein
VPDTLGLLEEAKQLARDLGYRVREEALGDLPGGACTIAGAAHVILNLEQTAAERLDVLLAVLASDTRVADEPKSRLLASRLRRIAASGEAAD